ncbi:MAG: zinc-ribbon and DUF3426 domain-containing protein [Nitrosomonadaceae bacterium]
MALVTRCPNCDTTFRVTAQHLKAHGGDVRCGSCAHIFNGFATLTTVQETKGDEPSVDLKGVKSDTITVTGVKEMGSSRPNSDHELRVAGELDPISSTVPRDIARETPDADNLTIEREFYELSEPRKNQGGWIAVSIFLVIMLAGQLIYSYRSEISIQVPSARPYLENYCELLGCTVPSSQQSDLLSIESSDLKSDPTTGDEAAVLTAVLRNYAPIPQAYPMLELTLTDVHEQALASHIFKPNEYLGREMRPEQTIAAGQEVEIRLRLDIGGLNVAGYKLFLLYQ